MILIIQCAATKRADAGRLAGAGDKPVVFVADPESAPRHDGVLYARPDDIAGGGSWRKMLKEYNDTPEDNPLDLFPAYQLYQNGIYARLEDRFGLHKVYILSAGWGLSARRCLGVESPVL
jgi:hypothetical protein